ncbi:MAG TPA: hypothetical protein IAB83_01215 [Candidatus Faecousia faecavium]|nr:hypothetical protein [Candidatus Faecousia faecavium]
MFDDPSRELRRLEEELLAEEEEEEEFEQSEEDEYGEYDEFFDEEDLNNALYGSDQGWVDNLDELLSEEPEVRNHANGYGTRMEAPRKKASQASKKKEKKAKKRSVYEEEEYEQLDEDAAVFDDDYKEKGIGGLVFLAILEIIGILAVVRWWIQWLG